MLRVVRACFCRSTVFGCLLAAAVAGLRLIADAAEAPQADGGSNRIEPLGAGENDVDYDQPVHKTNAEWKKLLTRNQYRVARLGETEPPFRGKYWRSKLHGTYHCVCCDAPLFSSDAKFDSGTGWPSFWAPVKDTRLNGRPDFSDGGFRIEVLCARCDAHLGHVFDDGPLPTGLRYCINSASLQLKQPAGAAANSEAQRPRAAKTETKARSRQGRPRRVDPPATSD